jgi:hypothetical protein
MSTVFDATGMDRSQYQAAMEKEEKFFAVGASPCKKEGHTIRERKGHCIQCSPKDIAFFMRYYKNAFVYISASRSKTLIKVGFSRDPDARERTLNSFSYGGADDWIRVCQLKCEHAGRIEFAVHEKLSRFSSPQTYVHEGLTTRCLEVFSCGYPTARKVLTDLLDVRQINNLQERKDALLNYNFPDRMML